MTPEFKVCVEAAGGTQKHLADAIGITEQAVGKWKNKKIPASRVLQIESAIGVPRKLIRPDLYATAA